MSRERQVRHFRHTASWRRSMGPNPNETIYGTSFKTPGFVRFRNRGGRGKEGCSEGRVYKNHNDNILLLNQ